MVWTPLVPVVAVLAFGRTIGWLSALGVVLANAAVAFPELSNISIGPPSATNSVRAFSATLAVIVELGFMTLWRSERDQHDRAQEATNAALRASLEELAVRTKEAEDLAAMRSQLITVVSHELNTPLNGIVGLAETLTLSACNEEQSRNARNLHHSAVLLENLIRDLLELTRLERESIRALPEPTHIPQLVTDLVELLRGKADARGLAIQSSLPEAMPLVLVDASRIRQVLLNLIQNAIKFTADGFVAIRVHATPLPNQHLHLQIDVEDSGPGIAPADQARIFERFEQGDPNIRRRHGGTGLGLAVVREVIHGLGGKSGVESRLGEGSRFWVSLDVPVVTTENATRPTHPMVGRVLVVDDNPINLLVAAQLLRSLGHEVQTAAGGVEALSTIDQFDADVVLMDCMMPDLTGWQTTERLRAQGCDLPIIAVTADASAEARARSLSSGRDDHLTKPLRREQLGRLIDRYLHQRRTLAAPSEASR